MIPTTKEGTTRAVMGGAVSGLVAGMFLTVMMTLMSASNGKDIWYGMKGASAPFFGERAMHAGFDLWPVLLGLSAHFAISAAWGVLFGLFFYGASKLLTVVGSVAWGFVVWIGMYYIVLPIVGLSAMTHDAPMGRAIMFHEMFSIPLGVVFLGWQRFENRLLWPAHATV